MITFITSLRHPDTMGSHARTYALLERTLKSITKQTSKNFEIIVVCHELPTLSQDFEKVRYVIVDFPAPTASADTLIKNIEAVRLDKGRKYLRALYEIKNSENLPDHIMFFDADDCLSEYLVETLEKGYEKGLSWVLEKGYVWSQGSGWILPINDLSKHCGTCYIFAWGVFELPEKEEDVGEEWLKNNLGSHRLVHTYLRARGVELRVFPRRSVIYMINTGENHSGNSGYTTFLGNKVYWKRWAKWLFALPYFRPLTKKIQKEFCI